jgi:AcrR family transcriptional regulator
MVYADSSNDGAEEQRYSTGLRVAAGREIFLTCYSGYGTLIPSNDGNYGWNLPMATPLQKARKDPDSMKAKILVTARQVFGEYGFHGATTRMIAKQVGIDISTLYYHWGEKSDLYEAVILDIYEDLRQKLRQVEGVIHGMEPEPRFRVSVEMMTDYLFEHREISNLVLLRYFSKTRDESILEIHVPEVISDIARSLGLCKDKRNVSHKISLLVLALMNAIHNFVSGEDFFRSMLKMEHEAYIVMAKETLHSIFLPAFMAGESSARS